MLTSPVTITIDGVAHNLDLINRDNFGADYRKHVAGSLEFYLRIRHSYEGKAGPGQMERHNVDLSHTTWDVDGVPTVRQTYHVIRNPRGVDPDGVSDDTVGLNTWLASNIAAIVAWRS